MSTSSTPGELRFTNLADAIEDIENAIQGLEAESVFNQADDLEDEDFSVTSGLDEEAIAYRTKELETALEIAADEMTMLIEPDAVDALSIDEILARFVANEMVSKESVETAGKLLECLGSAGSDPDDQGLSIGRMIGYDSLIQLVEDLRALAEQLENTE